MILADISSGHTDVADVCLLIAVVLAVVAAVAASGRALQVAWSGTLGWLALAAVALGLLLL